MYRIIILNGDFYDNKKQFYILEITNFKIDKPILLSSRITVRLTVFDRKIR